MPDSIERLRKALELDRDGDWDGAHKIVQGIESTDSYWIHAYLHRKEGDDRQSVILHCCGEDTASRSTACGCISLGKITQSL